MPKNDHPFGVFTAREIAGSEKKAIALILKNVGLYERELLRWISAQISNYRTWTEVDERWPNATQDAETVKEIEVALAILVNLHQKSPVVRARLNDECRREGFEFLETIQKMQMAAAYTLGKLPKRAKRGRSGGEALLRSGLLRAITAKLANLGMIGPSARNTANEIIKTAGIKISKSIDPQNQDRSIRRAVRPVDKNS